MRAAVVFMLLAMLTACKSGRTVAVRSATGTEKDSLRITRVTAKSMRADSVGVSMLMHCDSAVLVADTLSVFGMTVAVSRRERSVGISVADSVAVSATASAEVSSQISVAAPDQQNGQNLKRLLRATLVLAAVVVLVKYLRGRMSAR